MNKRKAYIEIIEVLERNSEVVSRDHEIDILSKLKSRVLLADIEDEFGITLPSRSNPDYVKINDHALISVIRGDYSSYISCPDDGLQPDNERLYQIRFPTGAYIFNDEYPAETFGKFFSELIEYGPKHIDSTNSCLYFTSEKAKAVHDNFEKIYNKHRALVKEELKLKRISKLKEELDSLDA